MLISRLFDSTIGLFQSISPLWALSLLSLMASLFMLLIFRYASNQQSIRETKNAIKAHLLEIWLFRDDFRIVLSAQLQILRLNGRYLRLATKPMLVLIVPLASVLIPLEGWFGYRPLHPGEAAIVSVQVNDGEIGFLERILLDVTNGLKVGSLPLRIPKAKEVDWRIQAVEPGIHKVSVRLLGHRLDKQVVVAQGLYRVSPSRLRSRFWQMLLHPNEPPILQPAAVQRIDIHYPKRIIRFFYWNVHWLVYFFVASIIFAFALKRLFRVEL